MPKWASGTDPCRMTDEPGKKYGQKTDAPGAIASTLSQARSLRNIASLLVYMQ
jgi:hypothetical protein